MKRVLRKLLEAVFFLLCYAPVPLLAGYLLTDNGFALLAITACVIPVAYIVSLLPGHVGGRRKQQEVFVERSRTGGDPDPDRNLRRDTYEDEKKSVSFPLRAFVCVILFLAIFVFMILGPFASLTVDWFRRIVTGLIPAVMMPVALVFCASGQSTDTRNVIAGIVLYAVAGIAGFAIRSTAYNTCIGLMGAGFLVSALWIVNNRAMHTGAASRTGVKPPAAMRRSNRLLLIGLIALATAVACFSWLKEKAAWLAATVGKALWRAFVFLASLMDQGGDTGGGGGGGTGDPNLGAMFGDAGEPSKFWHYLTYAAYVLAALVVLAVLIWLGRKIFRLCKMIAARVSAWLGRFAHSIGEDYSDEQESLLDWGEVQKEMGENVRKRLNALFQRDKKWEQMDGRERARHLVRVLYRRSHTKADDRTLREAAKDLKATDELVAVYETARYADREPDAALLERLRKDERV